MTDLGEVALRELALMVITGYAGPGADAPALASAARRAYEELARVATPLIGALGVDALMARAVHLAVREHPWLADRQHSPPAEGAIGALVAGVQQQDPSSAAAGAATVLAMFGRLLGSLIGEGLTSRLLRQAWPTGFLKGHE